MAMNTWWNWIWKAGARACMWRLPACAHSIICFFNSKFYQNLILTLGPRGCTSWHPILIINIKKFEAWLLFGSIAGPRPGCIIKLGLGLGYALAADRAENAQAGDLKGSSLPLTTQSDIGKSLPSLLGLGYSCQTVRDKSFTNTYSLRTNA